MPVRRYRYSKWRWRVLVGALDAAGAVAMAAWRQVRPRPEPGTPRRILVVQLDHLGDAVLSSPIFPRLKAAYPEARIDVLASPSNREVFEADPHVDRVRTAERNWFGRKPVARALGSAVWALGRSLRGVGYDLGIDVRGDVLTVLVLALAGIPRRVGWAMGGGGFLLTDVAPWAPDRHEVDSRLALLRAIGLEEGHEAGPARVVVHPTDRDRLRIGRQLEAAWAPREATARAIGSRIGGPHPLSGPLHIRGKGVRDRASTGLGWLDASAPLLAVHLGAGTSAKRWPPRHWARLVGRFLDDGWRVVIVGGPDDVAIGGELPPHERLRDWSGRLSLTETAALLERADLFIGADSGPAHLAACAALPSVVLFSGTNRVRQWRPWSRRSLVIRQRVACQPCHRKVCPLADHPCMAGIDPDRVYRVARRWWSRSNRGEVVPHA